MKPLTASEIRASFVNATRGEIDRVPMPGLHEVVWDDREYLGWGDHSAPQRGYLVVWRDDEPVGLVLRAAENHGRVGSAMCSLCATAQPSGQVTMFSAARAGDAGRAGNTVGTYICADLACSILIRIAPPPYELQPEPEALIARRSATLKARLHAFTTRVLDDAA